MNAPFERQQIIVSGVGGQGILFITRLLAGAAIYKGHPVLTAETHGMAQRGGVVVSHLKVGGFTSPLIRPARADVLLLLKEENMQNHLFYLAPGGVVIVNTPSQPGGAENMPENLKILRIDADALAKEVHQRGAVNLIVLGFALSALSRAGKQTFCGPEDIRTILHQKLADRDKLLNASISAFDLGVLRGGKVNI